MTIELEALEAALERATKGPWEVQDGCSWRRIGTARHDGNVLHPDTYSRDDRHPDLSAGKGEDLYANLNLIVAAVNALPALIAHIRAEPERLAAAVEAERDRVEAVLRVGEVMLDKCMSAWSCGEPAHRVKAMLDAADNFRAALNAYDSAIREQAHG